MTLGTSLIGGKFGVLLLAIWLIFTGLLPLLSVRLSPTLNQHGRVGDRCWFTDSASSITALEIFTVSDNS